VSSNGTAVAASGQREQEWRSSAAVRSAARGALELRGQLVWAAIGIAFLAYAPTIFLSRELFGVHLSYTDTLGIGISDVNFALISVIGAVALNLLVGTTGLISMGHTAFLALGALGGGILGVQAGLPFIVTALLTGLCGAAIGVVAGLPSARVSGLYLLLSTLALNAIVVYAFLRYSLAYFGAGYGIIYPVPTIGGLKFDDDRMWYYLLLVCAVGTIVAVRSALASREGRTLVAIRDHESAAASVGVNVSLAKLKAFAFSSFFVSIAGVLYAYYIANANPDIFTLELVIGYYAMIIVGGLGSVAGAVLGALLWSFFPAFLTMLSTHVDSGTPIVGNLLATQRSNVNTIIFGLLIIVLLILRPDGLIGFWRSLKASLARWPYST
jgi:branched-chain amino acid transport system permease protein